MKETIERLQTLADRATKYNYPEDSNMGVSISDILAVLDFYKSTIKESGLTEDEFNNGGYTDSELNCKGCMGPCGQCKDEPTNTQDITPEWDKILDGFYYFVAINADGEEYAYRDEPFFSNTSKTWNSCLSNILTRRKFNMKGIDWTKTLSKRPAK